MPLRLEVEQLKDEAQDRIQAQSDEVQDWQGHFDELTAALALAQEAIVDSLVHFANAHWCNNCGERLDKALSESTIQAAADEVRRLRVLRARVDAEWKAHEQHQRLNYWCPQCRFLFDLRALLDGPEEVGAHGV